ncbi:MAG: TIM barrel protein [Leeuwenhoekiella sp.]
MDKKSSYRRRDFIKTSSMGIAAIPFVNYHPNFWQKKADFTPISVSIFSKHLQFLDYNGMSEAAAEMGFDGIDLTVRHNGHVLPKQVATDLPKAVEAMHKVGFSPQIMTTDVTDSNDEINKTLLKTASDLGFKYYRMGWLEYPDNLSIPEAITYYHSQFVDLATLNKSLGLHGAYQNHSGKYVGAAVWDLYQILEGISPQWCGSQYDIRHATLEGANSWELGLRLIKDYIKTIVVKDFRWETKNGITEMVNTPMGEGMVDFKRYFGLLKSYGINVPVVMHFEYELGGAEHGNATLTIEKEVVFEKMKKDLAFVRNTWNNA